MDTQIDVGDKVKTTKENPSVSNWAEAAKTERLGRWGQEGTVTNSSNGHGQCFEVQFPDGKVAWYDPTELEPA